MDERCFLTPLPIHRPRALPPWSPRPEDTAILSQTQGCLCPDGEAAATHVKSPGTDGEHSRHPRTSERGKGDPGRGECRAAVTESGSASPFTHCLLLTSPPSGPPSSHLESKLETRCSEETTVITQHRAQCPTQSHSPNTAINQPSRNTDEATYRESTINTYSLAQQAWLSG